MKRILSFTFVAWALVSCTCSNSGPCAPNPQPDPIEEQLSAMTLREKVGQLFCVRPESFDTALEWDTYEKVASYQLREVTPQMLKVNAEYPVGGIILFAHNIDNPDQLDTLVKHLKAFNGSPLLYIDEEGGRVARIANNDNFQVKKYVSMGAIGQTGDPANAYECGHTIGTYLKRYGLDVDLAPVADVNTNPRNPVIGPRAFSDDPKLAAKMVVQYLKGLKKAGVAGCVKHFPGHGDTQTDTHFGYAQTGKTWEEMLSCEMVPFKAAIDNGVPMVMTAHIAAPAVTGTNEPATLSPVILTDKLRKELGFNGVIITDGMSMGAITRQYTPAQATLLSLQAGADIVLGPKDFMPAFDAVVAAVERDSTLTEARIDESVRRILKLKAQIRQ
jgi:beta-N-acetylhexosaminidase